MKKKKYTLTANSGPFLKAGGAFFYFTETEHLCIRFNSNRNEYVVFKGVKVVESSYDLPTIVKRIKHYYISQLGFVFHSKYTTIPNGFKVY